VPALVFSAPAKLNLFLAITGKRPDGFHDLVSVAAPLAWGDTLRVAPADEFSLTCDDPGVPTDETNLVLKAAQAFRAATAWRGGAKFFLEKRIPMGAGLGGGSSDGVSALRALNELAGAPLAPPALAALAAQLGSDCALFLAGGPVIMRGRGERIEALPPPATARLRGRRVLVFKPAFGISTPWAYARLSSFAKASEDKAGVYLPPADAEARLGAWVNDARAPAEALLYNNMERAAFAKHVALPALLRELQARFGLNARMSGSGSACYAWLTDDAPVPEITTAIRAAWGGATLVVETTLA
jgi:4-diphosphocytidyl-2-C-methyl-D-erythritol kinase